MQKYFLLSNIISIIFLSCISIGPVKSELAKVQGKIIESKADKKWKYRSTYLGRYDFHIYIKYEYEISGIVYTNDRINYWYTSYNSLKKAENALKNYPLNKKVDVYYNALNPIEAYLEVEDDFKDDEEE